ncbi:MAG: hypothetical protein AAGA68_27345 [Pseudomonadota bacterium]
MTRLTAEQATKAANIIKELCDDLESELQDRWQPEHHPASKARFDRDMDLVREGRAIAKELSMAIMGVSEEDIAESKVKRP